MRAFVGIPVPDDIADALEALGAELRFGRDVPAENMHITLAFLGDQPEAVLEEVHHALAVLAPRAPRIAFEGLDVFGGDRPRLLYAAIRPDPALTDLKQKIRRAVRSAGITLPHERFVPHVSLRRFSYLTDPDIDTLARFLSARGATQVPAFVPEDFTLVQSTLSPEGAVYDTLARYPLSP